MSNTETDTSQRLIREIPPMLLLWFGLGALLGTAASTIVGVEPVMWAGVVFMMVAAGAIWWNLGVAINES